MTRELDISQELSVATAVTDRVVTKCRLESQLI